MEVASILDAVSETLLKEVKSAKKREKIYQSLVVALAEHPEGAEDFDDVARTDPALEAVLLRSELVFADEPESDDDEVA